MRGSNPGYAGGYGFLVGIKPLKATVQTALCGPEVDVLVGNHGWRMRSGSRARDGHGRTLRGDGCRRRWSIHEEGNPLKTPRNPKVVTRVKPGTDGASGNCTWLSSGSREGEGRMEEQVVEAG
jgi:hypothetical protein